MSNSEPLHTVTISTDPEAEVVIFDGFDCVKERGIGNAKWDLPAGLYTVRAQLGGTQVQAMISVPETTSVSLAPPIYSPAPIDGAATTHEYYHDPAQTWSVQQTASLPALGVGGWLFLFVRLPDFNSPRHGNLVQGLTLLDTDGRMVLDFAEPGQSQRDDQFGWALVSTAIAPGFYRLRYEGQETRETSLYIYLGYSTQVFITYFHRPRIEQMRVFLRRVGEPFDASDLETRSVDLALLGLQNGIVSLAQTLPRTDQRSLLDGKFQNPMLGLVGAHWLLADPAAQPGFVNIVLTNLRMLLGPAPDVIALEIAAAKRFKMPTLPAEPVFTPPFLRRGLEILAQEQPELIPAGGLLESILPEMYLDSPWTSWRASPASSVGVLNAVMSSEAVVDEPLDWMESAVLTARLLGELKYTRMDAMARQLVVTTALLRSASARLERGLEGKSLVSRFNEAYLSEGQNPEVELEFENWAVRGAAVYNQPLPREFAHGTAFLRREKDVALRGSRGDVWFNISNGETSIGFGDWNATLLELADSRSTLGALLPKARPGGPTAFALSACYRSDTPRGAIALDSTGPKSKPLTPHLDVVSAGTSWRGLRDSVGLLLQDFGLPREIAKSSPSDHQSVLFAHVEGSFQFKFEVELSFNCFGLAEDLENWHSGEISYALKASGTLTASGVFQVGLFRDANGALKFTVHRAAPSVHAPIYLAEVDIAPRAWIDWLRNAAVGARDKSIATTLAEMADIFAKRVRERAFYHWLDFRGQRDESWYQAERVETQEVGSAIARVVSRQYVSDLRNLLEHREDDPLIEIETDGSKNAKHLEAALDGLFDLSGQKAKAILTGTLPSLARATQPCRMILGSGRPTLLADDGDRVVAVGGSLESPIVTIARMQAAAAAGKAVPKALSAPSAVFTSSFVGASSGLLRSLLSALVKRWFPGEHEGWPSFISHVGDQAGCSQWNAILQLKLRWAIDIRIGGSDLAPEPDLIHPVLRTELRLILPFLILRDLAAIANLKVAIPLLVYHSLPADVSSPTDLEMNSAVHTSVIDLLLSLRPAVEELGINAEEWNMPDWLRVASSSWQLKLLLSWEEHLNEVVSRALTQIFHNPRSRVASLDRLAIEIADAISGLPLLADRPYAVNALRTLFFTTAISLMASSPANISTELSITAVAPDTLPWASWIDSPDSMPLDKIIAYGRLTAIAESAIPSARKVRSAVA